MKDGARFLLYCTSQRRGRVAAYRDIPLFFVHFKCVKHEKIIFLKVSLYAPFFVLCRRSYGHSLSPAIETPKNYQSVKPIMFRNPQGRGHRRSEGAGRPRGTEHVGEVRGRGPGRSSQRGRSYRKNDVPNIISRYSIPKLDAAIMTKDDILLYGLMYVGFGEERQNIIAAKSVDRFKAHFGPEPRTVKDLMSDLCEKFPDTKFKEVLMSLNWLKAYDVEHVLAGRWGYDESVCRGKIRATTENIRSFKDTVIFLDPSSFRDEEIHIITVDCVNFIVQEFRLNPSTIWFDHKSHSSGLKYEFAVSVWSSKCVWINGPHPAGKCHDKALFCGAESMDCPRDTWDEEALLFQIPEGKKAIADSAYEGLPEKVTVKRPGHTVQVFRFLDRAQNRQESYHSRLKAYKILTDRFRHGTSSQDKMDLHKMAVEAVAVIVDYDMKYHPLFRVL